MANSKCNKEFKSKTGKVFKVGEVIGKTYVNSMPEEEKANFEHHDNNPDVPPSGGLGELDEHNKSSDDGQK